MASKNVIEITSDNFESEVSGGQPLLVDFWAPWCGPCLRLGPTIDKLADKYAGKVKVGKCNVDENGDLAAKFDVTSIPRVVVFKGGERPVASLTGLMPESEYTKALDSALAS